jgi:hypothetical protein
MRDAAEALHDHVHRLAAANRFDRAARLALDHVAETAFARQHEVVMRGAAFIRLRLLEAERVVALEALEQHAQIGRSERGCFFCDALVGNARPRGGGEGDEQQKKDDSDARHCCS